MARVRIESIGCRLNIGEMEALATTLAGRGHRMVTAGEAAELCVFNTCTVTAMASRKSRQILRQLRRANPGAVMVATGCYAEMAPDTVSALGMDLVVGNHDKDRLAEILEDSGLLANDETNSRALDQPKAGPDPHRRTRAFLKVQDGCDNACAYCVVTIARGPGRSRPPRVVIDDISRLLEAGYREIILSGVHLGSYGHDSGDRHGLKSLVESILDLGAVPRLRLSSLEPWDLSPDFFDLFTDPHLMPHLHLPLQSGCDATLRRMARKTTQEDYSALVADARKRVPDISISTDLMVGFPGETDAEFKQSLAYVKAMEFSHLHIFRYSIREGTPAATMDHQVPGPVATERSRQFHGLSAEAEARFARRFEGRELDVLWETAEDYGPGLRWSGLTPHALRAVTETPSGADLFNTIAPTRILQAIPGGVLGRVDGVSLPESP
ncbi:MAG: tRNA (N(6)-L-threonylcarbamoyladenosine(37)-C(2))-methylthiotransferase MtaB [Acidobacteriota bacterium]